MKCTRCKTENLRDAKFCKECGAKLKEISARIYMDRASGYIRIGKLKKAIAEYSG